MQNSANELPPKSEPTTSSIVLTVRGKGPVPGVKNRRFAVMKPDGKYKILTDRDVKAWKENMIKDFVSQLLCGSATSASTTLTAAQLRSLIASLPFDDRWRCIRRLIIESDPCEPGDEGATITITPL